GLAIVLFIGSMTYRIFASILSGSCALASFIIVSALVLQYPRHYSNPIQQRQIIWILFLIPWVALFSFLIVWKRDAGECLIGSLDFGCATALSSFLLLLCDYIFGHPDGVDELFSDWALKNRQSVTHSPKWLKHVRYTMLQFIHTCMIVWLTTVISVAVGTYCAQSQSPRFAHIRIAIPKVLITTIYLIAVLQCYGRMKHRLQPHVMLLKFIALTRTLSI
ncbi:organic solute transporter subunit alpha/Transmembrane protein, partial [Dendryphion nanum]